MSVFFGHSCSFELIILDSFHRLCTNVNDDLECSGQVTVFSLLFLWSWKWISTGSWQPRSVISIYSGHTIRAAGRRLFWILPRRRPTHARLKQMSSFMVLIWPDWYETTFCEEPNAFLTGCSGGSFISQACLSVNGRTARARPHRERK